MSNNHFDVFTNYGLQSGIFDDNIPSNIKKPLPKL
jgi:hypothetical protein